MYTVKSILTYLKTPEGLDVMQGYGTITGFCKDLKIL